MQSYVNNIVNLLMFTYQVRDLTNFNACVHGFQCLINRLKWGGTICPFFKRPSFGL